MKPFLLAASLCVSLPAKAAVKVMVSVLWEGMHVRQSNEEALGALTKNLPGVPVWHFVSPRYFLSDDAATRDRIKRRLGEKALVGLYLHPWQELSQRAGVAFRSGPSFWSGIGRANRCEGLCGHDVPLLAYGKKDLRRLVREGKQVLAEQGIKVAQAFLAAGWMANDRVLAAVKAEGFTHDFSLKGQVGSEAFEHYPLYRWLGTVGAAGAGMHRFAHVPGPVDHGGLETMLLHARDQGFVHVSLYQETAAQTWPRLKVFLDAFMAQARQRNEPVAYVATLKSLSVQG